MTPSASTPAYQPPSPRNAVALMDSYHSPQVEVEVRLNTNEAPVPPPPAFVERLTADLATVEWHRYPDRAATALRSGLAALHGLAVEQVFVANGSNEVLQSILLAHGGPGRTVLLFEPTYAMHSHIAQVVGSELVVGERRDDFTIDLDDALALMEEHQPSVVFLCSPNNPSGVVEDPEVVRAIVDAAPGIVVVDEAYAEFAPWSALELVAEDRPVVVTRTYSKTWSMAAARLGYLMGPSWLVADLDKVVLPYHLDTFKQLAGVAALDFLDDMRQRVADLVEERGRLVARLSQLPVDVWPSGANFVLFRPRSIEADELWRRLVDRSVLVRNCASWPRLEGCLRVTIGTPDEDDRFLSALEEILQ